jgi:phosphoribosyl 1,2-cyclic phosphodiesterase
MRFASLGSGSEGNGLVVEAGDTRVLMDCGFGLADTVSRLARLGLQPDDLAGIVVTHEHGDHIGGVGRLLRRAGMVHRHARAHGAERRRDGAADLAPGTGDQRGAAGRLEGIEAGLDALAGDGDGGARAFW